MVSNNLAKKSQPDLPATPSVSPERLEKVINTAEHEVARFSAAELQAEQYRRATPLGRVTDFLKDLKRFMEQLNETGRPDLSVQFKVLVSALRNSVKL